MVTYQETQVNKRIEKNLALLAFTFHSVSNNLFRSGLLWRHLTSVQARKFLLTDMILEKIYGSKKLTTYSSPSSLEDEELSDEFIPCRPQYKKPTSSGKKPTSSEDEELSDVPRRPRYKKPKFTIVEKMVKRAKKSKVYKFEIHQL